MPAGAIAHFPPPLTPPPSLPTHQGRHISLSPTPVHTKESASTVGLHKMTSLRSTNNLLATAVAALHFLLLGSASAQGLPANDDDGSSHSGTVRDYYVAVELVCVCEACVCRPYGS